MRPLSKEGDTPFAKEAESTRKQMRLETWVQVMSGTTLAEKAQRRYQKPRGAWSMEFAAVHLKCILTPQQRPLRDYSGARRAPF